MNYSAYPSPASQRREELLRALGASVRARRTDLGLTMRELARRADVSERFLAQLETGGGNISVARLQDVADALGTSPAELLSARAVPSLKRVVSLLGLRGAGKSSLGPELARRFGVPFFELDALVAREAGMPLATIFEMHGEAWFHRVERDVLRAFLDTHDAAVIATGGSIVKARDTFELLRKRTFTVWLRARPRDHWQRVLTQDARPMKNRANAMAELKALLREREPLYALADVTVDTSAATIDDATTRVMAAVCEGSAPKARVKVKEKR